MEKPRGRRCVLPLSLVCAFVLLACCPDTYALNPELDVSQYAHTSWKIRDGFPKGEISSIAQTPDGYLWIGTESGLFRFDGVKHIQWRPPAGQELPSNWIFSLLVSRDGTLWIGTAKGLVSWKDGKFTQYAELAERYIFKILEDREGTIWVSGAAVPVGKLCAIRNASVQCFGDDGSFGRAVFNLYEDGKGNLWAGVKDGLWRWRPGPPKFFPLTGQPDGIQSFGEDKDGTLLVGWNGGIHRFIDGKTEVYPFPGNARRFAAKRIIRDRDGALWIATSDQGVLHVRNGRADGFTEAQGLSGERVNMLFEDREGNIWIGTMNGLDRFRDSTVATLSVNQGLSNPRIRSVVADRNGGVWLSTPSNLNRWINGQVTILNVKHNAAFNPSSLFQDHAGRIWVSTTVEFGYLDNDRFIPVSNIPGVVTAIAQDTAKTLWFANEHAGLFQVAGDKVVQQIPWSRLGRSDHVSAMAVDPKGGIWLGFFLGGVAYYNDGQIRASYSTGEGLAGGLTGGLTAGRVGDIQLGPDGAIWIATESGLSRLKNGRIATLTTENGLPCDAVHWLREDDARSFWLYTACGLVRVARSEVDAWSNAVDHDANAKPKINLTLFDSADGVRIMASGNHFSPQVTKSTDGKLWFSTGDGVSVIDPNHLPFNNLQPTVQIEQVVADRKTYAAVNESGRLRLPPLIRDLQIDYTALSLVAPEKILFRYKLEGRDRDWQDAGNRRQVFYNDLGPGNYRFRVMACNNSGVWTETGTYVDFTIAPAYYQTVWFRVAVVAVFLLALVGLYQLRLRQVARVLRGRMEERLAERERIARDLHDTLLQSVQGLILKFHAVSKQIPADLPAHTALEKTLDHADQVLAEGRDSIRNLRVNSASLSDLPAAFRSVAEETSQGREAVFKTVVEGRVRDLHPLVLEECYCIGREAIINALSHSEGQNVEAEIAYDSRQFRLRVRDDGRGIAPEILEAGGRSGHWGLQGMRERAEKIGGQLRFWSRPETGTEVELTVPGATAYHGPSTGSKKIRFVRKEAPNATTEVEP
ncbi:MAG TPA: two-component regulator propeller domain-containing protein [Pyrinomonadaceae bacterium]|nr:two-component regulator propeller domain-containing protein [Pyrinomonadaceae bacterium]